VRGEGLESGRGGKRGQPVLTQIPGSTPGKNAVMTTLSSSFYLNQATWPIHKQTRTYRQTESIKMYNKKQ